MIKKLKNLIDSNKTLVSNFSYLSALQLFNMLLPLATYPYLIRVLGADLYGLVIFAQVISSYFGILIDFGFQISATKEISIHRDNKDELSRIISSVLIIKSIFWALSLISLLVLISIVPSFKEHWLLYLFSFALCFNDLLFPQWYFQGVERMKYITILNLVARTTFLILIFLIVKEQKDYLYVPLLNGVGAFIGGILGLYIVFFKDKVEFKWQNFSTLRVFVKESAPLFASRAIISVKDRFNVIFIGASLGMKEVAVYDLAIKIMTLLMKPVDVVNATIYPRMARDKNFKLLRKVTNWTLLLMIGLIIILQPLLPTIIDFLGKGLENALNPARVVLLAPIIMVWSLALARNCLIVYGEYKLFSLGMLLTTIFYLLLIGLAYLIGINHLLMTFILITVSTYLFELIYRYIIVKRKSLL